MKKSLGDILIEKGYISSQDLKKALSYQMRKILGKESKGDHITSFLLDIARTKYNNRDAFYLGKILTELKLLPAVKVQEALDIQKATPADKPSGRLDALNQVIVRMNSSYSLIDLLNQILVLAAQLAEAESASLIVYDHGRDCLVILVPTGPGAEAVRDLEIPKNRGIVGWVYQHSRPLISNDPAHDARFYAAIDAASGYTSRQLLCVPLTVKDRRLGAIEAINKIQIPGQPTRGFSAADQFLLGMFSAQAAVAIENTRLAVTLAQVEEDLALRATTVAEAQKAQAGAMVADYILHEMEQSLIPLQGYADRLREVSDDARVQKYRSYIDREMGRVLGRTEIVARFLSDDLAPNMERVSLRDILEQLESRIWVDCRVAGIAFVLDVTDGAEANADKELLVRALENIFRNSRDAMPGGGTFSVTMRRTDPASVTIEITDTGTGIRVVPVESIFAPFASTGKRHAAGLGLSIARKIVELHGGTIRASNRPEAAGAMVTISLPCL